jgi:hypothetical protein
MPEQSVAGSLCQLGRHNLVDEPYKARFVVSGRGFLGLTQNGISFMNVGAQCHSSYKPGRVLRESGCIPYTEGLIGPMSIEWISLMPYKDCHRAVWYCRVLECQNAASWYHL